MSLAHDIARTALFLTQFEVKKHVPIPTRQPSVAPSEATVVSLGAAGALLEMPWYVDETQSVTLTAASRAYGGTLEVWHLDSETEQLCLSSGYFGTSDEFKRITAATRFAPRCGLPGRVWDQQRPILLEDLTKSRAFLRADAARTIGLEFGLGLPVPYPRGLGVVVLLSTRSTPIARSIDIWKLRDSGELDHVQSFSPYSQTGYGSTLRGVAESLALAAARQFTPLATGTVTTPGSQYLPQRSPAGFAWPSRDAAGETFVATLVS